MYEMALFENEGANSNFLWANQRFPILACLDAPKTRSRSCTGSCDSLTLPGIICSTFVQMRASDIE